MGNDGVGPARADNRSLLPDRYHTPWTRFESTLSSGVEIHATTLADFLQNDWISPISDPAEVIVILGIGFVCAIWFVRLTPLQAAGAALLGATVTLVVGYMLFTYERRLFPWMAVAGPQMLAAWGVSFLPLKRAFISYRRADGEHVAFLIAEELRRHGVETFIDIATEEGGLLDERLLPEVRRRPNLILILTPSVLTAWNPHKDWICEEITIALEHSHRIVPVDVGGAARQVREQFTAEHKPLPAPLEKAIDDHLLETYDARDHPATQPSVPSRSPGWFLSSKQW